MSLNIGSDLNFKSNYQNLQFSDVIGLDTPATPINTNYNCTNISATSSFSLSFYNFSRQRQLEKFNLFNSKVNK